MLYIGVLGIGTPMVAAGLWKREDIDRTEAQLFRSVNGLPNIISNKAIHE